MAYRPTAVYAGFYEEIDIELIKMERGYIVKYSNIKDYSENDFIDDETILVLKLVKFKVRITDKAGNPIGRINY